MKKLFLFPIFTFLFLFLFEPVFAGVSVVSVNAQQTFASVRVTFTEPSVDWDENGNPTANPLTDLSHHFIYWRVNAGGWNQLQVTPSSQTGGQLIIQQIDNVGVGPQESNTFESYYSSVDDNFNESAPSLIESLPIVIDKSPPAPPIP